MRGQCGDIRLGRRRIGLRIERIISILYCTAASKDTLPIRISRHAVFQNRLQRNLPGRFCTAFAFQQQNIVKVRDTGLANAVTRHLSHINAVHRHLPIFNHHSDLSAWNILFADEGQLGGENVRVPGRFNQASYSWVQGLAGSC